jgi:D-arabinose 1-dehydrogenase-like Zn-dependent alcohol dehydrogenase
LIGSTGGTRKHLQESIDISNGLQNKIWRKYKIDDTVQALPALFAKERDGRILINIG